MPGQDAHRRGSLLCAAECRPARERLADSEVQSLRTGRRSRRLCSNSQSDVDHFRITHVDHCQQRRGPDVHSTDPSARPTRACHHVSHLTRREGEQGCASRRVKQASTHLPIIGKWRRRTHSDATRYVGRRGSRPLAALRDDRDRASAGMRPPPRRPQPRLRRPSARDDQARHDRSKGRPGSPFGGAYGWVNGWDPLRHDQATE